MVVRSIGGNTNVDLWAHTTVTGAKRKEDICKTSISANIWQYWHYVHPMFWHNAPVPKSREYNINN